MAFQVSDGVAEFDRNAVGIPEARDGFVESWRNMCARVNFHGVSRDHRPEPEVMAVTFFLVGFRAALRALKDGAK